MVGKGRWLLVWPQLMTKGDEEKKKDAHGEFAAIRFDCDSPSNELSPGFRSLSMKAKRPKGTTWSGRILVEGALVTFLGAGDAVNDV